MWAVTNQILVATRNPGKLREIREILFDLDMQWLSLADFPTLPPTIEDGKTFEENAVKKAVEAGRRTGKWTLADDSGLEVPALGRAPGVRSARYAGETADDAANIARLLAEMKGQTDRRAIFRCVVALWDPSDRIRVATGQCEGYLLATPRGTAGFGYDPLFVPNGWDQTFAELSPAVKNRISHRGRALLVVRQWLISGSNPGS